MITMKTINKEESLGLYFA